MHSRTPKVLFAYTAMPIMLVLAPACNREVPPPSRESGAATVPHAVSAPTKQVDGVTGKEDSALVSLAGYWRGTLTAEGNTMRVELDIDHRGGRYTGTLDLPDAALFNLPLSKISLVGNSFSAEQVHSVETTKMTGTLHGNKITGRMETPDSDGVLEFTRIRPRARLFVEEDLRFTNGDVTLAGTLLKPVGPGPHPCVVWTHGSGKTNRKRSNTYRRDAYRLVRHGVASLIYDKRGVGESTGTYDRKASFHDLAGDAVAGIEAVAKRADINAKQIGVGGISQGGWLSPLAATMTSKVAFIIVLSAAGTDALDQATFVMENQLEKGLDAEPVARIVAYDKSVKHFCRTGEDEPELLNTHMGFKSEPWFVQIRLPGPPFESYCKGLPKAWFLDPVPLWEKITVPVLGIWGADDELVPAESSRKIIAAALQRAGNKDVTLRVFPGANHELYVIPKDWQNLGLPQMAPGAQELMVEWVLKRVDVAE